MGPCGHFEVQVLSSDPMRCDVVQRGNWSYPSISSTVNDTFSVEYWRDLEMRVTGRSRSLKMAPIDRSYTT